MRRSGSCSVDEVRPLGLAIFANIMCFDKVEPIEMRWAEVYGEKLKDVGVKSCDRRVRCNMSL